MIRLRDVECCQVNPETSDSQSRFLDACYK